MLRVKVQDLAPSGAGLGRTGQERGDVERALFAPRSVDSEGGPVSFAEVTTVHAAYGRVLAGLPQLMDRLAAVGDPRVLAAGWAVVARMLTKEGSDDLALVAAERARDAAWSSGDRADLGMAVYQVVCALLPTGRAGIGEQLATCTAEELADPDDAVRSV